VDASLGDEAMRRVGYDGKNIEVLETRFSPQDWFPDGSKEEKVLTVAMVPDRSRIYIKGIDVLLKAAHRSPTTLFDIVGVEERMLDGLDIPENVLIHGRRSGEEILRLMQSSKVYCQPSRREGLSNALCEAMLCGCIPVATDVGGSRRAVGETGFLVTADDDGALGDAIARALLKSASEGLEARERIMTEFPEEKRYARLRDIIEG
jgi:glycosyltransferase involved in cell wall biosynthesis